MDHIFPPQRFGQYSAVCAENQPCPAGSFKIRPNPPRLVKLSVSVLAGIARVQEQENLSLSCRIRDPV